MNKVFVITREDEDGTVIVGIVSREDVADKITAWLDVLDRPCTYECRVAQVDDFEKISQEIDGHVNEKRLTQIYNMIDDV